MGARSGPSVCFSGCVFFLGFITLLPSYFLTLGYFSRSDPADIYWEVENEEEVREIIPKLKQAGAQGIIEYPLNKLIC